MQFRQRGSFRCLVFLTLVLLGGCQGCSGDPDAYPSSFTYPPRSDWLVLQVPKDPPAGPEPPGELDESIQRLNERGGQALDPTRIREGRRQELMATLGRMFGTPARPAIGGMPELEASAAELGLTPDHLATGSRLFRKYCQECHGPTGNGRGPTAPWITPHPRDFRLGVFKFVSTPGTAARKPNRADLFNTITHGLPGTQMPSFRLRSEEDRQRLVDYVIFLAIRGRTEFEVLRTMLTEGDDAVGNVDQEAIDVAIRELNAWKAASAAVMPAERPAVTEESPEFAESVRRGHRVFLDQKGAACITCHGDYGRDARWQYDVWGTVVKPGDLTDNRRKGGSEPAQLYRRIRGGIGPSNMPAATSLTEDQTWDVVHFLMVLPYPDRLPPDVRDVVYPRR